MAEKTVTIDTTLLVQEILTGLLAAFGFAGATVASAGGVASTTGVAATGGAAGTSTTSMHKTDTEIAEKYTGMAADWADRSRIYFDRMQTNAITYDGELRSVALKCLSNAVGTYGLSDIQSRAHRDLAHDRKWNINETDFVASQSLRDLNSGGAVTTGMLAAMASSIASDVVKGMSADK